MLIWSSEYSSPWSFVLIYNNMTIWQLNKIQITFGWGLNWFSPVLLVIVHSGAGGSTHRNGTCFTASECANKGGAAAGSCAAGWVPCMYFVLASMAKQDFAVIFIFILFFVHTLFVIFLYWSPNDQLLNIHYLDCLLQEPGLLSQSLSSELLDMILWRRYILSTK